MKLSQETRDRAERITDLFTNTFSRNYLTRIETGLSYFRRMFLLQTFAGGTAARYN